MEMESDTDMQFGVTFFVIKLCGVVELGSP